MREYLKKNKSLNETNFLTVSGISVIIKDPIDFSMSTDDIKQTLDGLPNHFLTDVDYIIFGDFDFLKKNGYNASYMDGAIYASNIQQDNVNVLDDIVHEVGHAVEDKYNNFIYSDGEIEREFVSKRMLLCKEMERHGINLSRSVMSNPEYNKELDHYFSDVIGYPKMTSYAQGIFYSPYGATSLREYFANGFEAYFFHKDFYLKKVSPILFDRLEKLETGE